MISSPAGDRAREEIEAQRSALHRRIEESGLYQNEIEEFDVAVRAYGQIFSELGIDEDVRSLATSESRNLIRLVRLRDSSLAVLKIIGNTREPGEGELLAAWYQEGLPTIKPLSWGYTRVATHDAAYTATYLLTGFIESKPLTQPSSPAQRNERASELVSLVRPFHHARIQVPRARRWSDRLAQHLRWTLPLLRDQRAPEPDQWANKLDRLSQDGHLVIHGDPAGNNVLDSSSGLLLIDPPGALIAMPEADIAQICSQVGGVDATPEVINLVTNQDPTLDPSAVAAFAGLNFLIWGGYLLASHTNPDARRSGQATSDQRDEAKHYFSLAHELLSEYRL